MINKATMRCAIYARVSKETCNMCGHLKSEHAIGKQKCGAKKCACQAYQGQDAENQLAQQRQYASSQSWSIVEFVDYDTGKHAKRDELQKLFASAARREFDVVLVWALDRFTREGVSETFLHLKKLNDYGVAFESLTEPHFRTTGPVGELLIAIMAWVAKTERQRISDRTKAGLVRVRAQGKKLGRPVNVFRRDHAQKLRAAGKSWRAVGLELGVPFATVRRALSNGNGVSKTS
jgi:DNA invertase Pin-like site-specific DNA recombinase